MKGITPQELRGILLTGFAGVVLTILVSLFQGLFLLALILPIPYIVVLNKYGHRAGTLSIGVTAVTNFILVGFPGLVFSLVSYGLVAIVVGGAFYEKYKPTRIMLLSVVSYVASGLISYYLFYKMGILTQYHDLIRENLTLLNQIPNFALTPEQIELQLNAIFITLPGIISGFSIVVGIANYYLAAYFLRRLEFDIERIKPFKEWIFPRWTALVFLLFLILPEDVVSANILIVLTTILVIEGVAVIVYYGDRWGLYPWVRNVFVIAVLILFNYFIWILGLIDTLFNLRRLQRKQRE